MAHFAKIGLNNKVIEVQSVVNEVLHDSNGVEQEVNGIDFLTKLTGWSIWVQTSYNNNFRKAYAGIGMVYDPIKNKFLSQQPHASWSLDANDDWQAPVIYPTVTTYGSNDPLDTYLISWDEAGQQWTAKDHEDPQNNFNWDASALAWVSA